MEKIIQPRASGKTAKMIEWLREDEEHILVTYSTHEEKRLHRLYPELLERIFFWGRWIENNQYGIGKKYIAIDNADIILQSHSKHPIMKITMSSE